MAEKLEEPARYLGQRTRLAHALGLVAPAERMASATLLAMTACVGPRDERVAKLLEVPAYLEAEKGCINEATRLIEQARMIFQRFTRDNHPRKRSLLQELAHLSPGTTEQRRRPDSATTATRRIPPCG